MFQITLPDNSAVVKTAKLLKRRKEMLTKVKSAKPKAPKKTKKAAAAPAKK